MQTVVGTIQDYPVSLQLPSCPFCVQLNSRQLACTGTGFPVSPFNWVANVLIGFLRSIEKYFDLACATMARQVVKHHTIEVI
jgi:hypothetical protein